MSLGKRLKQLRIDKDLKIRELAKIFSIGKTTASNYENDVRKPDYEMIQRFADFYNVTTDYLIKGTNAKKEYTIEELREIAPDEIKDLLTKENIKYLEFMKEMKEEDIDLEVFKKIMATVIELKNQYGKE